AAPHPQAHAASRLRRRRARTPPTRGPASAPLQHRTGAARRNAIQTTRCWAPPAVVIVTLLITCGPPERGCSGAAITCGSGGGGGCGGGGCGGGATHRRFLQPPLTLTSRSGVIDSRAEIDTEGVVRSRMTRLGAADVPRGPGVVSSS